MNEPNELDNQPKVPNDPTARLPEATRGQIQSIVSNNPEIENLRRIKHKEVMMGNTYHLKTGKFSKQLPPYLINYLSFIDELTFDRPEVSRDVAIRLLKGNLKRIALAEYREQVDRSTIDQTLSKLIRDTFIMATNIHQTPSLLQVEDEVDIRNMNLSKEQIEAFDDLIESLRVLSEPDELEYAIPS